VARLLGEPEPRVVPSTIGRSAGQHAEFA